jgi:hypothetical protein
MAEEIIGLKVQLDTSGVQAPMKSLRAEIKEANNELLQMTDSFGSTSKEAINAAKKVAELKDRLGDAKQMVDAFNPDAKFNALSQALQGAVGGFEAFQGTMGLMGIESENLEKSLLKVQSAMALSQGLSSFLDGGLEGFRNLARVVGTTVSGAFSTLKGAMISTGIGALVVLLGVAIANFDDLSVAIGLTTKEQQALNSINSDVSKSMEDVYKNVNEVGNAMQKAKAGTISKTEALKVYNEKLGDSLGHTNDFNIAEKNLRDKTPGYIAAMQARITMQVSMAKIAELQAKIAVTKNVEDLSMLDRAIDLVGGTYMKVTGNLAGAQLLSSSLVEKNKQGLEDQVKEYQKIVDLKSKEVELQEKQSNINTNGNTNHSSTYTKSTSTKTKSASTKNTAEVKEIKPPKFDDFEIKEEEEKQKNLLKVKKDFNQEYIDFVSQELQPKLVEHSGIEIEIAHRTAEDKKRIRELEIEGQREMMGAGLSILDTLSSAMGAHSEAGKAMAIASTTIKTYEAAQNAFTTASLNVPATTATFGAYPYIMASAAVVAGIAKVKAIASTNAKGSSGSGGGGSSAAPVAPSRQIFNTTTKINKDSIDKLNDKAVKAYVVETDISNNQKRIERILINTKFK